MASSCARPQWQTQDRTVYTTYCRFGVIKQERPLHLRCIRRLASACTETQDFPVRSLPAQFLRAADPSNYDANGQRVDVAYDSETGKPMHVSSSKTDVDIRDCVLIDNAYRVTWKDGRVSEYTKAWVQAQVESWQGTQYKVEESRKRVLWTGFTAESVRSSTELYLQFGDVLQPIGWKQALRSLYRYGIVLVRNTPTTDGGAGIAALAAAIGGGSVKNHTSLVPGYLDGSSDVICSPQGTDGPLRTLYGTVWSTTSSGQPDGTSTADSAYGHASLPLHTDMTYMRDPPGLQIFTMARPATKGGESVFGDGFAAAEFLRGTNPAAFATLSSTTRRYRSVDASTGWHLEASGPIITVLDRNGHQDSVVGIRHNDLDRLPDLPPPSADPDEFYSQLIEAHQAWDEILARDDFRLVIGLEPGETMVVANQRCFHGRFSFDTSVASPRSVMGCYVGQDELASRFRMEDYEYY
jgi:alpha-ketoglutarate-dependent taurine dioxygenase